MKFELVCNDYLFIPEDRIARLGGAWEALEQDAGFCGRISGWIKTTFESAEFTRMLELTSNTAGMSIRVFPKLSSRELEQISLYALAPHKTLDLSLDANELNFDYLYSLPFYEGERRCEIKIPEMLFVDKANIPERGFGMPEGGPEMFLMHQSTCNVLKHEALTGFDAFPARSVSGDIYKDIVVMKVTNVMPPAVKDETRALHTHKYSFRNSVAKKLKIGGAVSYSHGDIMLSKDVNFSCEQIWWNMGGTIVSRRFKECFRKHKLKGLKFEPVLDASTDLYRSYLTKWSELVNMIKKYNCYNEINYRW